MLEPWQISNYYIHSSLDVPKQWNLSRKHFRFVSLNDKFMKLNIRENRINRRELREYCIRLQPLHVYFSVLDWLFPERVGKKYKANYAVPVGDGEYVIDVDSYLLRRGHTHEVSTVWNVCPICLGFAKKLTLQACLRLEWYYSDIHIVFSGKSGFHIHVLDFKVSDWTKRGYKDLVKRHEAARFKFSQTIALDTFCFDRPHFILSADPMRVITVPNTLNGETGLKCISIGSRKDFEHRTIENILWQAKSMREQYGYPELFRSDEIQRIKQGGGTTARVTAMTPPLTTFENISQTLQDSGR